METRYTHSPEDIRHYSTEQLRKEFLVEKVFEPNQVKLTYTHNDRMIFGGVMPVEGKLTIELSTELGVDYFLQRREMGVINIGGPGVIEIDGVSENMVKQDGYYIGKETREIAFSSVSAEDPAKFYVVSVPAHHKYPNKKLSIEKIVPLCMGESNTLNQRKIYQYVHPNQCESCQLQLGYTVLEPGSSWNTMPCHTHERRMETYLYFDMEPDTRVFHFMGTPQETKHLVVGNEEACISPSWSIHSGVGTSNYTFIWGMAGENITYTDMDMVPMQDLK